MRNRIVVVSSIAVVLAVVAMLRGTPEEKPPPAEPVAAGPVRLPASVKATTAPPHHEGPAPPAPVAHVAGAVRLPSTDVYENAANLKELADALEPRAAAGDKEAARSLARILDECFPMTVFPNYVAGFRNGLSNFPAERRGAAQRHIDRLEQRCADFVRSGRSSPQRLRDLDRQGMAVDDLVTLARRIAEDPAAMPAAERTDALRRIISSRNGEALFVVADAMAYVDDADNSLLNRRFSGADTSIYAWKFVGCDFGAPCGQDSAFVRHACAFFNYCVPGGYRDLVRFFSLSPYQFELATEQARAIVEAINGGRLDELF